MTSVKFSGFGPPVSITLLQPIITMVCFWANTPSPLSADVDVERDGASGDGYFQDENHEPVMQRRLRPEDNILPLLDAQDAQTLQIDVMGMENEKKVTQ